MKAYILTENDMELLKTTMEKWEAQCRKDIPEAQFANTPAGQVLKTVHYDLWGWMQKVKGNQ